MNNILLSLIAVLTMSLGIIEDTIAISANEYAVVINLSGRQRMLTQKMSKEMLLIAKGVDVEANRAALKNTAKLFDSTLKGLLGDLAVDPSATSNKIIRKQLGKVEKLWNKFHLHVNAVLAGDSVPIEKIATENLPLLKNMNTAVRLYEKEAKKATGKSAGVVINLAGKQRMLTQKMSKEILLISLNHNVESTKGNLRSTSSLFDRTLKGLRDGDDDLDLPGTKNSNIVAQLDKVAELWKAFKPLVDSAADIDSQDISMDALQKIAQLNLPLLKEMNKAVKMYEVAAR